MYRKKQHIQGSVLPSVSGIHSKGRGGLGTYLLCGLQYALLYGLPFSTLCTIILWTPPFYSMHYYFMDSFFLQYALFYGLPLSTVCTILWTRSVKVLRHSLH